MPHLLCSTLFIASALASLPSAPPPCARALRLSLSGNDAGAASLWRAELAVRPQRCAYASTLAGIALARSPASDGAGRSAGLRLLSEALAADPSDWVAASYLGAAHELLARRLSANSSFGSSGAYEAALSRSAELLRAAVAGRDAWVARASPEAYLPAQLAQPATLLYRSLGQVLLWSHAEAEARRVYAAGVAAGIGWVTPWARPNNPRALALSPPVAVFRAARWRSLRGTLAALEAGLPAVRREWAALRAGGGAALEPESAGLQADAGWSLMLLTVSGAPRGGGCAAAPATCALLAALPLAAHVREGSARFSVLAAGARIKPHAGPTHARLRVHCTLALLWGGPAAATFRVGPPGRASQLHWSDAPGERCFAIDESFEHEVWTASEEEVAAAAAQARGEAPKTEELEVEVGAEAHARSGSSPSDLDADRAPLGWERVVLLVDIANPFLASHGDWEELALATSARNAAPVEAAELEEVWQAAQEDAAERRGAYGE